MTPALKAKRLADRYIVNGHPVSRSAPHGTWGGYTNWFCRCGLCRAANTQGWRRWSGRTDQ